MFLFRNIKNIEQKIVQLLVNVNKYTEYFISAEGNEACGAGLWQLMGPCWKSNGYWRAVLHLIALFLISKDSCKVLSQHFLTEHLLLVPVLESNDVTRDFHP